MAGIYPSLEDKFRNEGICPICMMSIGHATKYACVNDHVMCHRCKPYYYACPTCRSQLDIEILPPTGGGYQMPLPTHYMPHPYSPYPAGDNPSAPFLDEERHSWAPPPPTEDQDLKHCGFCFAGCAARFPEHLRQIHESRCQFRPNLEDDQLSTDLTCDEDNLIDCRYCTVGCNVRLPEWRKAVHEEICIYKDRVRALDGMIEGLNELSFQDGPEESFYDPEEMVDCRWRKYGCMVRMPRRRQSSHEEKCNYANYEESESSAEEEDPDAQVPCVWAEYGCQVCPRLCRKEGHEEKCNYRMEYCSYRDDGCDAMFQPPRRYAHEKNCEYA